tara:strand:- start:3428 stop:5113 length:1686 start_codon:yes stop_codon:yes gene_type:complete
MSAVGRVREAVDVLRGRTVISVRESAEYSTLDSDPFWQRVGSGRGGLVKGRGLTAATQNQMLDLAHRFHKGNPLGKRMVEIPAEYVVGDGIQYRAEDEQVGTILDAHWTDSTNRWGIEQFRLVQDLGLEGEVCIPVYVNQVNGHVQLGNISPNMIEDVIEDPENNMRPIAVFLKKLGKEKERRAYKVIGPSSATSGDATGRFVGLPVNDKEKQLFGFEFKVGDKVELPKSTTKKSAVWAGSCFLFQINNPRSSSRGWSDLFSSMDWLDAHDQLLFSQTEKAVESARYIWDILLKGKTEEQIIDWLSKQPPMKPGERVAHNENVEYNVKQPDLRLEDMATFAGTIKNHALAGVGLPPFWFSESMGTRATAPEMTEPTFKHLKIRQRFVAYMVSEVFRFVIDMAVLKNRLKIDNRLSDEHKSGVESTAFYLRMPDVSAKDQRALANAILSMSKSLQAAVESMFISTEEASRLYQQYLTMTGLDAWKLEPKYKRGEDTLPDERFNPNALFAKVTEGKTEQTVVDSTYYMFRDPNLLHGTKIATESYEKLREARVNGASEGQLVK